MPHSTLIKWLSFNRIGTFSSFQSDDLRFIPGITRPDIYCPIVESMPVFDLAVLFHELQLCTHVEFMLQAMKYRKIFIAQYGKDKIESSDNTMYVFNSQRTYLDIPTKVSTRLKRKLRFAFTEGIKDQEFLNFLTQKGHTKWRPLITESGFNQ